MAETITGILDAAASRWPEREYLRLGCESLSYADVASKSNRIAGALRKLGVRAGDPVAILTTKLRGVLSIYGAMKAGAVAIPLDAALPPARMAATIRDCGAACVISEELFRPSAAAMARCGLRVRYMAGMNGDSDLPGAAAPWAEMMAEDGENGCEAVDASDIAYVLYTSGSTGAPKGIAHTHASAVAFARWGAREFDIGSEDRLGNHSGLHFDLSTFDLFAAACAGAATVLVPRSTAMFPRDVASLIARERITVWYSVPFVWMEALRTGAVDDVDLSCLRVILFAGERFPPKQLAELMRAIPGARFANLFGPTETNVCAWHELASPPDDFESPIPIGHPCPYAEVRIGEGRKGEEEGELLVGGATRLACYWREPGLTSGALTEDGYYRTGDYVRLDSAGLLHFVGRRDRQVKVRGFRVELDEIELALQALPDVLDCAVWTLQEPAEIVAAASLPASSGQTAENLLAALAQQLPPAAVPCHLTIHTALPRTTTGKLDRGAIAKGVNA